MARIPYAQLTPAEIRPLAERIVAERGSIRHLYQMLLHSSPLAGGWLSYLTSIRHLSSLPGAWRELVIMCVAILNSAPYGAARHAPIGLKRHDAGTAGRSHGVAAKRTIRQAAARDLGVHRCNDVECPCASIGV